MKTNWLVSLLVLETIAFAALFLSSGNFSSVAYALVIGIVFFAIEFFRKTFKPPKISREEFEELNAKYKKNVDWIDIGSIVALVVETGIVFFLVTTIKQYLLPITQGTVFFSNPVGLIFLGSFLFSLATIGWIMDWIVSKRFGKKYWIYYYHLPRAGFDSKKVYSIISIIGLLTGFPALVFGLQDYTIVTNDNGINLNDWTRVTEKHYGWSDIESIRSSTQNEKKHYTISFSDGTNWSTSNERWNADEKKVMEFISIKSHREIE